MAFEPILSRNVGNPKVLSVAGYRDAGGYEGLAKALAMEPGEVIDEVKTSGLRGRGGAGFPAGLKWCFIPKTDKPKYLVCNADESEPGTFKDRVLMESDPHQLIEGCAICCYAIGASTCYIYIRGEYVEPANILERAIGEAYEAGVLGDNVLGSGFKLDMRVHRGAGAYICGEETGLLESLEGKRGQPRIKPPFPAVVGAFGCPTVINNVETLCNVPHIIDRGGDWFRGHRHRRAQHRPQALLRLRPREAPRRLRVPDRRHPRRRARQRRRHARRAEAQGLHSRRRVGADARRRRSRDVPMDFDSLAKAGSMLGSAAVIVMDETTCLVRSVARLANFFAHESCGQCTPCREGTDWSAMVLARIEAGKGSATDLDLLLRMTNNMSGTTLCALADAAVWPLRSLAAELPPTSSRPTSATGAARIPSAATSPPGARPMPEVTIDGRTIEVERGTTLIEAALKVGVQIPHYCYHPRLSIVGQLPHVPGRGRGHAQAADRLHHPGDDGRHEVVVDDPEVKEAQRGMMEFLLINHPLDCPICDQAGECGLQDYSFEHGQAFSRFRYEEKRTYPGRERIPLGPTVVLNMNRCIQCTRCIRFTDEVSGTSELGFFQRGARTEIGVFPGKVLDNDLSTCVVDICPVGALTSTRFRFAERVWYLDKKPSICTGCDAGCNITLEHRRGVIRRYKPRFNPDVNDYWMCDHGRTTFEPYVAAGARLESPRHNTNGEPAATDWSQVLKAANQALLAAAGDGRIAFLAGGDLSTEEAFLLARLADAVRSPHRAVHVDAGPERAIPNLHGGLRGSETAPNRRGAELAGLVPGAGGVGAADLVAGEAAAGCAVLVVAGDLGRAADDPATVERLRAARALVVLGWRDSALARAADLALPLATHAESEGTFVNSQRRLQRFVRAFPPAGQALSGVEALGALLRGFEPDLPDPLSPAQVFDRLAAAVPELAGLELAALPPFGAVLPDHRRRPAGGRLRRLPG